MSAGLGGLLLGIFYICGMNRVFIFIVLIAVLLVGCEPEKSSRREGRLEVVDSIKVVNVYGSWSDMGSQYGRLLSEELGDIWNVKLSGGMNDEAWAIADSLYSHYPRRFKEFLEACAESSGLGLERMKAVNAMEYIDWVLTNCSGVAVWGARTSPSPSSLTSCNQSANTLTSCNQSANAPTSCNQSTLRPTAAESPTPSTELIYGRTYDAGAFHEVGRDIVLTVFHPDDSRYSLATVGFAGEIYCVNGMNSVGMFLELNSGAPSAGFRQNFGITPGPVSLFEMMLEAGTMEEVDMFMNNTPSSASFVIGVADSEEARSYEWCAKGCKRGDSYSDDLPQGGQIMVQTNHYVNPGWDFPAQVDSTSWSSLSRRSNIIRWVTDRSGTIDEAAMREFVETPFENGGIFKESTEYMVVAVPYRRRISLYIPGYIGWHSIGLAGYFEE